MIVFDRITLNIESIKPSNPNVIFLLARRLRLLLIESKIFLLIYYPFVLDMFANLHINGLKKCLRTPKEDRKKMQDRFTLITDVL